MSLTCNLPARHAGDHANTPGEPLNPCGEPLTTPKK
jgi:hypothetical protein